MLHKDLPVTVESKHKITVAEKIYIINKVPGYVYHNMLDSLSLVEYWVNHVSNKQNTGPPPNSGEHSTHHKRNSLHLLCQAQLRVGLEMQII